jgi:hypothetical protein
MEPVVVAWEGNDTAVSLRLPVTRAEARVRARLQLETGEDKHFEFGLKPLSTRESADPNITATSSPICAINSRMPDGCGSTM